MDIYFLPIISQLGAASIHYLWCYLCVRKTFGEELTAIAIADTTTYFLMFLLTSLSTLCAPADTKVGLDWTIVEGWGQFVKEALPKASIFWSQALAWALLIVFAGTLGVEDQAAMFILL